MSIADNITLAKNALGPGVSLVAVSKYQPLGPITEAYDAGQRLFGENHAQELQVKAPALPPDIEWHFIGHLQSNKIAHVVPHAQYIDSVDTEKLLYKIDDAAQRAGKTINVLMQVRVADELSKTGFTPLALLRFFAQRGYDRLKATRIRGIMGMATNTPNKERVDQDMRRIRAIYDEIRHIAPDLHGFDIVSMGMSQDYPEALAAGTTMVRLGTAIFGPRPQK